MRSFSGDTDVVHNVDVDADVRAYFSATVARLNEGVWLRVEARWIADGAPLHVTIYREDEQDGQETVKELDGKIASGEWEQKWKIELPRSRLDELRGLIRLVFKAKLDGYPLQVRSQDLLVHRTRFSS